MNLWHLKIVLLQLAHQLSRIELAIAPTSLDDLGLLLQCEVLPGEIRTDVFLEERQDFVVGNGAWIGEVVDSGFFVFGEEDGGGEKVMKDSVGVRDIDYTLVLGDLGYEVSGVEIVGHGHTETENQAVRVEFHDLLNVGLGLGVERSSKIGLVSLEVSRSANWMGIVVGIDATSSKDGDVNAFQEASIGQVQGTNDIVSDGLLLMVLTPVDIWSAS